MKNRCCYTFNTPCSTRSTHNYNNNKIISTTEIRVKSMARIKIESESPRPYPESESSRKSFKLATRVGLESDSSRTRVGLESDSSRTRVGLESDSSRTRVGLESDSSRTRVIATRVNKSVHSLFICDLTIYDDYKHESNHT